MVKVYDIKNTKNSIIEKKFFNVIDDINNGLYNDKLKLNYVDLKETYTNFSSFTVVVDDTNVLAFSGLQEFNFPAGHSRALSRTFYTHTARKLSLGPRELPSLASGCMLPLQVEIAKRQNLDNVFISFEEHLKRLNFVNKFTNMLQTIYPTEKWKKLSGVYNTTPHVKSKSWQHIVVTELKEHNFKLEKKNEK